MDDAVAFAPPPRPDSHEWPGTPAGLSNMVTRVRGPVPVDRDVDAAKGAALRQLARRALEGERSYVFDAVMHGARVRLFSDSHHVGTLWNDHWFDPQEWRGRSGLVVAPGPRWTVYVTSCPGRPPSGFVCPELRTTILFNCSWYAAVRAEALTAASRVLAEEDGVHTLRASGVAVEERAILSLGFGRTTSVFALMEAPGARFFSDDAVFVRYAFRRRDGEWMAPVAGTGTAGSSAVGWRVFEWLQQNAENRRARVSGVLLRGQAAEAAVGDLELEQPRAFAYLSERRAYVRTMLARGHPQIAWALLQGKIENAPEAGEEAVDGVITEVARAAAQTASVLGRQYFASLPEPKQREVLRRLVAYDGTRCLLDLEQAFGRSRVVTNPMEPSVVAAVALTRVGGGEGSGQALSWEQLQERVAMGGDAEQELYRQLYRSVPVNDGGEGGKALARFLA